jgi:uncharacterized delta-60 repeat protein
MSNSSAMSIHAAGDLDTRFGSNGTADLAQTAENGKGARPAVLETLRDGSLIVVLDGYREGFWIARYTADGDRDESFGTHGATRYRFDTQTAYGYDVGVLFCDQDAEALYVLGAYTIASPLETKGFVVKLTAQGLPDPNFGDRGHLTFSLPAFRSDNQVATSRYFVRTAQRAGSGRLILGINSLHESYLDPAYIVAISADGQLDRSFGNQGFRQFVWGNQNRLISAVHEEPDGQILVAGHTATAPYIGLVARYTANGTSDLHFGKDGFYNLDLSPKFKSRIHAMAQAIDGGTVCVGELEHIDPQFSQLLRFKLTRQGTLDSGYGESGVAQIAGDFEGNDVSIAGAQDLSTVAGGLHGLGMLSRANPNGAVDDQFGRQGIVEDPTAEPFNLIAEAADGAIFTLGLRKADQAPVIKRWFGHA